MGGTEHAICQIVRNGRIAGLGFAVDGRHVVTCAHVINAALKPEGRELREPSPPSAEFEFGVHFPIGPAGSGADLTATLAPDGWLPRDQSRFEADDVALLQLSGEVPGGVPIPRSSAAARSTAQLWGPAAGRPEGVHTTGELLGEVTGGRLQVNVDGHGFQVRRGFSGGPVWHRETGAILGMLAACGEGDIDAYLLPVETISKVWQLWREPVSASPADSRFSVRPTWRWAAALTRELAESLRACPSMEDVRFRESLMRRMGEQLGMLGPFVDGSDSDVYAIARACEAYEEQGMALAVLVAAMKDLHPNCDALARLEGCDAALKGLTALGMDQLAPVIDAIASMSPEYGYADFHELARQAFGKPVPLLRGAMDLPGVVHRLNGARENAPGRAPVIVRFLALLADSLEGDDRFRLEAEVENIGDELGISLGDIHADLADSASQAPDRRILQIIVEEISAPGPQARYAIDATVFDVLPGRRQRIASWKFDRNCSLQEIDDSGARFLRLAGGLGRAVGIRADVMVEFVLPGSLLDHPVERWGLDEDGYWIGYRFPVVVRSQDRQKYKSSYKLWLEKWEILVSEDGRPIGERIGWLHYGNVAVPEHAVTAGRIIHLTGRHNIVPWLTRPENCFTAGLALTFPYRHEDDICRRGVQDAIREGIPLLVWCRDDSDANDLERLLEKVKLRDLGETVRRWRRLTADSEDSVDGAMRDIVLLLDDPADAGDPSRHSFKAPQHGR